MTTCDLDTNYSRRYRCFILKYLENTQKLQISIVKGKFVLKILDTRQRGLCVCF